MPRLLTVIASLRRPALWLSGAAGLCLALSACNTPNVDEPRPSVQQSRPLPQFQTESRPVAPATDPLGRPAAFGATRVAMLVPLTGEGSGAGTALLQAAQMAVLNAAPDDFILMPFDTGGTPQGASEAANEAIAAGAELILGPLFSRSVPQVAAYAAPYGVNVISFSNDARVAGDNVYVMGLLPQGQVDRILSYAASQGLYDVAVLVPANDYGQTILQAAEFSASRYGVRLTQKRTVAPNATFDPVIESLSQGPMLDAALLAEGGLRLREAAGFFGFYEMPDVQLLGTSLWDDPSLWQEPALAGGWFPATNSETTATFDMQYQEAFGETPPSIAILGYDAASLAALLARDGGPMKFTDSALQSPSGFTGYGGVFRFTPDRLAQRGLAVMEIRQGEAVLRDQAPTAFTPAGS